MFGLELEARLTFERERIVFLRAGAARVELIQAPGSAVRRPTGVVDHVAFEVRDIDATLAMLRARGVKLLDATPLEVPALQARIAFCEGPDGERIELFEPPSRPPPRQPPAANASQSKRARAAIERTSPRGD